MLLHPRFWAEEGTVWFKKAYEGGFADALFFIYSENGYLNLAANLCAAVASRFPLEYAPYVTTYLSLVYLLVLFALILWNESDIFAGSYAKLIACGIVLFAPTNHEEIWLTSVHIMGLGGICSLFILLDDPTRAGLLKKHAYRILLVLNTLTGPYTVMLAVPFFLMLLVDTKGRKERAVQFGIILGCSLIQSAIFVYSVHSYGFVDIRIVPFSLYKSAVYVFKWQLLDPLLGFTLADKVLGMLGVSVTGQGHITGSLIPSGVLCMTLLLISISLLWLGKKDADQVVLIASFVIVASFTAYCALHRVPHNRYAVLPGVIILLALFNVMRHSLAGIRGFRETFKGSKRHVLASLTPGVAAAALLFLSLSSGAISYWRITYNDYTKAPLWHDEVEQWRLDPQRPLGIFPHPQWKIHLKPKP